MAATDPAPTRVPRAVGTTFKEFKDFAFRGSVLDLAIGVVIGAAFNSVVQAVVGDLLTPLIGLVGGNTDLANTTISVAGAELAVGHLINTLIYFLITAMVLFIIVKAVGKVRRSAAVVNVAMQPCRFCLEPVPVAARRCRSCTSDLTEQLLPAPRPATAPPAPARAAAVPATVGATNGSRR